MRAEFVHGSRTRLHSSHLAFPYSHIIKANVIIPNPAQEASEGLSNRGKEPVSKFCSEVFW
ncbi:hypothetical protein V6Z11_D13G119700 [Gossypium hirsutum]